MKLAAIFQDSEHHFIFQNEAKILHRLFTDGRTDAPPKVFYNLQPWPSAERGR